jgi:hypothetical protein
MAKRWDVDAAKALLLITRQDAVLAINKVYAMQCGEKR